MAHGFPAVKHTIMALKENFYVPNSSLMAAMMDRIKYWLGQDCIMGVFHLLPTHLAKVTWDILLLQRSYKCSNNMLDDLK